MAWKELAAQVGTQALVGGLRAIEGKVSRRQYRRLIATAVAQLLELHPKLGRKKARRWARKATGERPLKRALGAANDIGVKEGLGAAAVAAAGAGAAKVVRSLARPGKRGVGAGRRVTADEPSPEH